jgi:hypothetical protein
LILPDLGEFKLVKLSPARVREWHSALGPPTPTRNAHAYSLLHAICATAVQDELLDGNPCRIPKASQTKRRHQVDVLTLAELDKLAAKMPEHLGLTVTLASVADFRILTKTVAWLDNIRLPTTAFGASRVTGKSVSSAGKTEQMSS